ncbi:chemotaxis-specific protein-glutamate methyltransferase CheB [Telluria aromaticivorans]|uniref:protein-glutamate methylesterase n=1 Tax=Telluria aromaticivorans TaxID=2725995 RepID=A0A7Y2JWU3_9BURK|nr:chemotaxis-specific protein-glutamate methyltransferase CheB [Telluria aromaticivorans]NNG22386.1 chemotaxis-specific protein-glutamate methyltransferase CheB [Telluria aromaticivorans]
MRIGIANDVILAAEALRRVVTAGTGHQVAWIARTGLDAVRLCAEDRPDLVLMDLNMPGLDGVEATRRIMLASPCAVLVVTGHPHDNVGQVFRALGAGALDVTATPVLAGDGSGAAELLAKIKTIGKLIRFDRTASFAAGAGRGRPHLPAGRIRHLLAIGASTGGPMAIAAILAGWQAPPDTAIVVVQHIDASFAGHFARWLDEQLGMPVRVVAENDVLQGGVVQVAQSNDHLALSAGQRFHYQSEPVDNPYRPSVDVLFGCVASHWAGSATGVLLTGMGRDGAAGLLAMRRAGHATIAQDRASCAVYGMPRAAAEINAATDILPLEKISAAIRDRIRD